MKHMIIQRRRIVPSVILMAVLWGATGCANMDLMGRRLDMASERVGFAKPVYEGHIKSAERIGAMVALQFSDGKEFDVADCPSTLVPGDIVRVYKTENGFTAHLWSSRPSLLKS
jgi:hypothetical protein